MSRIRPRLRTANKIAPPYTLGQFPASLAYAVGREVIYLLATKPTQKLEGEEWERIFAKGIGAKWKPSNIGLDDIVLGNCAWGAKTVYNKNPWKCSRVRLISGRNSPVYSYGDAVSTAQPPEEVGHKVIEIWNARVDSVRSKFRHVRTVVLIKGKDLTKLAIFETETLRYDARQFEWIWNKRGNLEGWQDDNHRFTWQPHGSQFTIIEDVPDSRLKIRLLRPRQITPEEVLDAIGFEEKTWIEVIQ